MDMAKSFIHYQEIKGVQYASVYTPRKVNGKKDNQPQYLGRVIDKAQGIYRNRERGIFKYSLTDGFSPTVTEPQPVREEKLILDFGDAYVLHQILVKYGYWDLFRDIIPGWEDTLCTMLFYRLLRGGPGSYAADWWAESYLRVICPNARVESQRVSEFYAALGDELVSQRFFRQYLAKVCEGQKNHGILVDSTGMPNDIQFPLTAVNNHNGVISNETRLVLVVDRLTRMPLLYRYNAGNIVDVSTLKSTILELSAYGVSVDFSILDAGYYSDRNIEVLYAEGIRFITRLCTNRKLYKDMLTEHASGLECRGNAVFYRDRLLYMKRVPVKLCGHDGYAYVALDHQRRSQEVYEFMRRVLEDGELSDEEIDRKVKNKGIFILLSSEKVEISEILPLYYTRQAIEQVFDLYKNNAELLPLRAHSEETFRGHLMLSFISTVAYLLINRLLEGSKYCADGAFRVLHTLKCKVFDDCVLVKEGTKKVNDIAMHLKLTLPLKI
jgi:hypothetical protein